MTTRQIGEEGFRWFIGIVEDLEDPKVLGRARVRVLNENDGQDTSELHWAHILMPTTSACVDGVGDSPNLSVGSRVLGFYLDGNEKQQPMVLGTMPTIPGNDGNRHSLSWLHRGKNIISKIPVGPEPGPAYAAEYPFNRTITTRAGHAIEIDDTPENNRIHIFHASGAYVEINNEGRVVIKSPVESLDIAGGVKTIFANGNVDIQSSNNVTVKAGNGIKMEAPGGVTITQGSLTVQGAISSAVGVSGTFTSPTGKVVQVQNGIVVNIAK